MFSLLDFLFTTIINLMTLFGFGSAKPRPREVIAHNKEKISSFYFLPLTTRRNNYLFKKIVKKEGTSYIYGLNALYHMNSNVRISLDRINKTYELSREDVKEAIKKGHKINIFGQSLGTIFAIRLASEFHCEKLVIVIPGDKLGECAWESWLIRYNARNSGLKRKDYCEVYREYDSEKYADKMTSSTS